VGYTYSIGPLICGVVPGVRADHTAPALALLLYRLSCGVLRLLVLAGVDERELEIAVLRHQLRILHRRGKRARYRAADRAFLAAVSRFLPRERWHCCVGRSQGEMDRQPRTSIRSRGPVR
jgi:hypothetical protein